MLTTLLLSFALGVPLDDSLESPPPARAKAGRAPPQDSRLIGPVAARDSHALRRDLRDALQRTAEWMKSNPSRAAAHLLPLYAELRCDTVMVKEDRDRYAAIFRDRLLKLSKKLDQHTASGSATASKAAASHATATPTSAQFASASRVENRGGAAVEDYGRELVALIQHVIAPDTWDVAGGNGVIMYYQPLHVLVIRQTDDVHEQIGGGFKQLRKN
jgi:hypothetical protein